MEQTEKLFIKGNTAQILDKTAGKIFAAAQTQNCGGSHTDIIKISSDLSVLADGGNFYLDDNIDLDSQITITKDVKLCLNGNTIDAKSKSHIFQVNGGSLTLCDCQGGGELTHGIGGSDSSYGNGGAVNIEKTAALYIMYSGEISDNTVVGNGGNRCINSGGQA